MEMKPGYKLSDVGVIPEDWAVSSVEEHFTIKSGFAFSSSYFSDKGPIVLTPGNFRLDGGLYFNDRNTKHYSGPYSRSMQFDYNDLLIVMTDLTPDCNLLGKPAFVRSREPILHNQRIGKIAPINGRVSVDFLYWFLMSDAFAARMKVTATGSTVRHTSNGSVYRSLIPLPPTKTEQDAIAEALSDADALIESLEQLIAKKRHLKQGATLELLTGRNRLPGFVGKWDQVNLGELFTFKNGLNKGKEFFGYGTPIVNYMDVFRSSKINCSDLNGRVSLSVQEMKNFNVRKGDVLFTRTSETPEEVGLASVVLDEPYQTVFSGFVLRARPRNAMLCNQFKAYCFRSDHVRRQIVAKASYTTRALTNGRILSAVVLPVPSPAEQTAIAAILTDMDAEIAALEAKLAKARQIKQGMMHNLLTGKIRLI